jgi:putative ABC transport system permease protein
MTPLPLSGSDSQSSYYIEGSPLPEPGRQPSAENFQVTGETFSLLDMPLLAGRTFDARDRPDSPRVAIVDVLFAERNFGPGVNPVGRRFAYGSGPPADEKGYYEIVGLVPHIQNYGPGKPTREQTYRAYSQSAPGSMTFVLHTSHDGAAMEATLRAAMREVAPDLPIFLVRAYDDLLIQSTAAQRVTLQLLGVFAVLGLLLAALGLYGVLSTIVGQRTREIGIRVALGATAASVTNLVIRHGLKMSVLGLLLGVAASFAATRAMASLLHEFSPTDPLTIGLVLILLLTVGLAACWLPARRASRVNPIVALRAE